MSNYKEASSTSHHPFHPRKGHPARPMRSYESIKSELSGKANALKKAKLDKHQTKNLRSQIREGENRHGEGIGSYDKHGNPMY
jgi:hypothetical protein